MRIFLSLCSASVRKRRKNRENTLYCTARTEEIPPPPLSLSFLAKASPFFLFLLRSSQIVLQSPLSDSRGKEGETNEEGAHKVPIFSGGGGSVEKCQSTDSGEVGKERKIYKEGGASSYSYSSILKKAFCVTGAILLEKGEIYSTCTSDILACSLAKKWMENLIWNHLINLFSSTIGVLMLVS